MKSEDIARIAGVSRSTVSRVINNYPNVPEATREKVMQVVSEYNYMPNTFARTLAGKRSNTIGIFFVVTGENITGSRIARNDYFASYLNYLVDFATGKDYYVLINTISNEKDYEKVNQAFLEKRIDGGIIVGTQDDTLSQIHLENIRSSLIIYDYDVEKLRFHHGQSTGISVINCNDYEGINRAVVYLKDLGHTHIGFIRGNEVTRSARVRFDAYKRAMKLNGLKAKSKYYVQGEFSRVVAYENVKVAIEEGNVPTAYVCANDYMAIGAISALNEAGLRVPEDVSIIGFDNTHSSEQSVPPLTTLEPKYLDMSKRGVELLDLHIQGHGTRVAGIVEYGVDLVLRSSCCQVK